MKWTVSETQYSTVHKCSVSPDRHKKFFSHFVVDVMTSLPIVIFISGLSSVTCLALQNTIMEGGHYRVH